MNKKKIAVSAATVALSSVMAFGTFGFLTGCTKTTDQLIVMSEAMDGLFNPFFATAGPDMEAVGMTQLSMLTTDSQGHIAYGKDEATVVLDYKIDNPDNPESADAKTTYYFVIKNGITFSDGKPLTMNDVLFNMYVYLDPVYTGATTMYSTDIVGLSEYRTQRISSSGAGSADDAISTLANTRAFNRVLELSTLFETTGRTGSGASTSYDADESKMKDAINSYSAFTDGYREAVTNDENVSVDDLRKQLLADYNFTLETFKEELESDYESAKESYKDSSPYKEWDATNPTYKFSDEVLSFMFMEGYVSIEYTDSKRTVIKSVTPEYNTNTIKTKEAAIEHVYNDKISTELNGILSYYATANTVRTDYIAKATEIILHEQASTSEDGVPVVAPNIKGIVSMGHSTDENSITIDGTTYNIAKNHNADGTVANADEYDVLRVQINGVDPKAIWNFAFTVAPHHYYSDTAKYPVDIKANKFGVSWGSYDFMKEVIQGNNGYGVSKNKVPLGAGAYIATDRNNNDNPAANGFNDNNSVFFKANDNFVLGEPKIKKVVYQVVSATNAIDVLRAGSVHFVTPQFTIDNDKAIKELANKGIESISTWQLGYGYIGVNAGKVEDINIRKAIMSAMDIKLALHFYSSGTVANIAFPMSLVSWAYPRQTGATLDPNDPRVGMETSNGKEYMQYTTDDNAKTLIKKYMGLAGAVEGDSRLKIKFTIAGSNLTDHPVYSVFAKAAELLNECGWNVDVVPDTNALTKLSTGSLAVWAAAWGSTIDPDMYQVYHKNSTATSVLSWGYREILASTSKYPEENIILTSLSSLIDAGRKTNDEAERTKIYKDAMSKVLDLAVEMPVYQRQTLYAYNAKVIDTTTFPESINSYSSPLGKIWEIDFVK